MTLERQALISAVSARRILHYIYVCVCVCVLQNSVNKLGEERL